MSTDQNHSGDELFTTPAIDENEGGTDDSASTTADDQGAEESHTPEAEKKRQQMVQAWKAKVLADPSKMDELKTKHAWLAEEVAKELTAQNEANTKADEAKLAELARKEAEKLIEEREAAKEFESLKARLNQLKTTKSQREVIEAKMQELITFGVPKAKALETAALAAKVDISPEAVRRQEMSMPSMSGTQYKDDDVRSKVMNQANLSPEDIREIALQKSSAFKHVKPRSRN